MAGDEIISFYADQYDEATRCLSGAGLLEFFRTQAIIEPHLTEAPMQIADIGGGPGIYAEWLARLGHHVTLIDPVPTHVEQANQRSPESGGSLVAQVGDALDVHLDDSTVDISLLLGPLYHLPEPADRQRALAESLRILRPGGRIFAAGISRFASLHDGLARSWLSSPMFAEIANKDLATGRHENPERHPNWFTTAYFHRPDELHVELEEAGFDNAIVVGVEGVPGWFDDLDERLADPEQRTTLLGVLSSLEAEQSLVGASAHFVALGAKP